MNMTWRWDNSTSMEQWYHQNEMDRMGLRIRVSKKGKTLCNILGYNFYSISVPELDEKSHRDVELCLQMSGLKELQISLVDNKKSISMSTTTADRDFKQKFNQIIDNRILVPDTNALMNRVFSALELILTIQIFGNTSISVPRLVLLELERIANQNTQKNKTIPKNKVMIGYSEFMVLKNHGAELLSELDKEILLNFNKISGGLSTDAWIRQEVHKVISELPEKEGLKEYTFVTSDLVNSLSSTAENLPVMYISKVPHNQGIRQALISQIVRLVISLSIIFEEISVTLNEKEFKYKGMYEGKSTIDWIEERISYAGPFELKERVQEVLENFEKFDSEIIIDVLKLVKNEFVTEEVKEYISSKLEEISLSKDMEQRKLLKKLKPYLYSFSEKIN